jgi:hypothetical protein
MGVKTATAIVLGQMRQDARGLSDEQLLDILQVWELIPVEQDGEVKAVGLVNGTEFHCHLEPGFRLSRTQMREFLRPLLQRHGYLTTRVAHGDQANQRFNRVFGFSKTWADDEFQYFILTKLPFEEGTPCQQ